MCAINILYVTPPQRSCQKPKAALPCHIICDPHEFFNFYGGNALITSWTTAPKEAAARRGNWLPQGPPPGPIWGRQRRPPRPPLPPRPPPPGGRPRSTSRQPWLWRPLRTCPPSSMTLIKVRVGEGMNCAWSLRPSTLIHCDKCAELTGSLKLGNVRVF